MIEVSEELLRGFQELLLREFKGSYAIAKIPHSQLLGQCYLYGDGSLGYDLVLAFQFLCLPKEVRHWNISTLRRELRWLPAEWAPTGQSETPHAAGQVPSPGPVFETPAGDFQSQAA